MAAASRDAREHGRRPTARAATYDDRDEGEEGESTMGSQRSVGRGQWARGGLGVAGVHNGEANDVGDEEVEGGVSGDEAVQRVGLWGGRRDVHRATGGDGEEVR